MRRLGPELKMPDVKVPTFLSDVYWDLRERRLLPVLALVVVATIAVPFLLGSSSETPPPPAQAATGAVAVEKADASTLKVVEATPGLRDYRKRLEHRQPHNPFKQKFTGSVTKGAQLNPETTTTSSSTTTTTSGESSEGGAGAPGSSGPTTGGPVTTPSSNGSRHGELTLFTYAINVKITKSGGKNAKNSKPKPTVKKRVLPQTSIPSDKTPVVTFMGPGRNDENKSTGKALLLVSNDVNSVFGETHCVTGDEVCQLIEVEPGFPVTFVYGENEVHYTINVLKLGLVITARKKYSREARMLVP
jgi:hypothetical protein